MAYSDEVEVISALCKNKDIHTMYDSGADQLIKYCEDIWGFIKDYYSQTKQIPDSELVATRFRDFDPVDAGPTIYHIDKLRSAYLDETMRNTVRKAANLVQNNETAKALKELTSDISTISRVTARSRDIDVTDVDDAISYFEKLRESAETGCVGIKTNIAAFDACLPMGISKGQLGVLLAYPAIGKSWLSLYFAVQAWKVGRTPMVISLEMTEHEVRNRIFTILGNGKFSHRAMSAGRLNEDDFRQWADSELKNKPPFKIISNEIGSETTPNLIASKIEQYKPDIVFIDYLQLMSDNSGTTSNETVKIKNLSRELKMLAIQHELPVIAIASATPDDASDLESVPQLGQVAWSKQIAYDADFVLALGRKQNSDAIEAAFRKNRNGYLGDFILVADFDSGRFKEYNDLS
jgi:replicative DNA helicase